MTGDERRGPDEERSGSDASPPDSSETGDLDDLDDLSYRELQSLAADHGVSPVGKTSNDLREHIAEARAEERGEQDGDTDDDEESTGGTLTEIPTVDPDDPEAGTPAAETNGDAGTDDDAETDEEAGDPAVNPDGSIPDWVKSEEPTIDEVLGPSEADREDEDPAEDRVSPDEEMDGENPFENVGADPDGARAQSDGGATVPASGERNVDYDYYDEDDGFIEGPESDQEMPLADHIEEMIKRLGVVILSMALVSVLVLPFAVDLINFIWYSILGSVQSSVTSPRAYQPLALVLARLKVATLAGFVIALPVFVYETYLFMRPGLYKHERRYYLAAVPTSLVLAFIGVAFAFYLVLPFIFSYFVNYSEQAAEVAFGLSETFGLMLLLMGFFAAVFQIPLLIMLAVMMGLTTRQWLADRRLYFWGGFLGVALLFSPDPTGLAPFIVAITMVTLFEATLLLLRWTQR
ncbi:twin-arginine translocase subunit TatC [Halomarina oriensis]